METNPELLNTYYGTDGVDVPLSRWMLSLSLEERLDVLQQSVNSIVELRNAAGRGL